MGGPIPAYAGRPTVALYGPPGAILGAGMGDRILAERQYALEIISNLRTEMGWRRERDSNPRYGLP